MSVTHPDDPLALDVVRGDTARGDARPPEVVSPFKLFEVLWRRKLTLFVVAAAVLLAAVPRILSMPARYEGLALVLVDTRKNKLSDLQAIVTGAQSEVIEVRTQVDILRSAALGEQVVTRLDLLREREFVPVLNQKPPEWQAALNTVLDLLGLGAPARAPYTEDEKIRLVTQSLLNDKLTIINDGRSYVIGIAVRTDEPELSARIANSYARVYLDFNRELKDRAVTRANAWLDERLAPLQQKLRNAERSVAAFREANGLVEDRGTGPGGEKRATVAGQQLTQLNSQMVLAANERLLREAVAEEVRRVQQARGDLTSLPLVLASPLIHRLRTQEAELGAREASLALNQSEESPSLLGLRAERRDVRARIQQETLKIIGAIDSEVNAARSREAALRAGLAEVQAQVAVQAKAEIRLRELESEAEAARSVYTDYLNRSERTSNERDIQQPDAELISLASVPFSPAPPTKRQFLILAFMAAGLIGALAALLRERMEPGFRTADQMEAETGLVALGLVPHVQHRKRALALDARDAAFVEAVSHVRGVLQIAGLAGRPRVILITSAMPQEGKTFFAIALARAVALTGARCLLVDCDLRRPSVAAVLGITAEPGLGAESLARPEPGQSVVAAGGEIDRMVRRDVATQLDIITAADAPADASVLVASERLRQLVSEARARYDLVIIDAPPVLAFVDARVLSRVADSTVMVVRWRRTPRLLVMAALKALRIYGARVAGTVLTQVDLGAAGAADGRQSYVLRRYGSYFR